MTVGKLGFTCVEKGNIDRNENNFFSLSQPLFDLRISGKDIMVISVKVRDDGETIRNSYSSSYGPSVLL